MVVNDHVNNTVKIKLVKKISANDRVPWIIEHKFVKGSVIVYMCVDSKTKIPVVRMFSRYGQKVIEYLIDIVTLDKVPTDLISKIRRIIFIDMTTNRTLRLPKP